MSTVKYYGISILLIFRNQISPRWANTIHGMSNLIFIRLNIPYCLPVVFFYQIVLYVMCFRVTTCGTRYRSGQRSATRVIGSC